MKKISSLLLGMSIAAVPIAFVLPGHPPDFFNEYISHWIQYPPIWYVSAFLFIAAIIIKKIQKERPYPFIPAVLFFFLQAFFAFGPLTPFPMLLILLFTSFYRLFILEKSEA